VIAAVAASTITNYTAASRGRLSKQCFRLTPGPGENAESRQCHDVIAASEAADSVSEVSLMSEHIVNTNGAAIHVTDGGAAEPALIFLHYWGGSSQTWQGVVDRLGETRRVIVLDQRGWGHSVATDGRYDLAAMADDVEAVAHTLGLKRYVLVGHSMGGKVAQIVAARRPTGLLGLVLIAPAPPTPMPVPEEQRAAMLASYGSREGVMQALSVLAGSPLPTELRERVIENTLRGAEGAKRAWTESGMVADVSAGLDAVAVPVTVVIGDCDQVEHEAALRDIFARLLPLTTFRVLNGVGHLSPLEASDAVAQACSIFLDQLCNKERPNGR
jgi:pimeloyl-ACP methyl ester carboxylesterase